MKIKDSDAFTSAQVWAQAAVMAVPVASAMASMRVRRESRLRVTGELLWLRKGCLPGG